MWKKRHRRPKPIRVSGLPRRIMDGLAEAERLSKRGRHAEAREVLESLDHQFPNRIEILNNLYNENVFLNDLRGVEGVAMKLSRLDPDNADLTLSLAGAHLANQRPALALLAFRRFLERWPEREGAARAREAISKIEPVVNEILTDYGFAGDDAFDLGALHEEAQALLAQGEYAEARDRLNQLLQRRPDFISAINNLSLIALAEGQVEEAIETARRALERDENNFHALANLIRFLVLRGRSDEARVYVEQLKAIEAQGPEVCLKQIEALSFLGDDRGALDVFRKVEQSGWKLSARDAAFIHHLAAVATMRSGDEDEAKRLWKRALESAPGFELASSNLRDLDKPVSERHAPWPFNLGEWVPRTAIEDLSEQVRNIHPGGEEAVMRAGRRFIEQHPEMNTLIPILLERGDPVGREFGVRAAMIAQTPETLAALRDFALGQRGPDQMRLQASQTAVKHGALDAGLNRLWLDGEWREILLMGFEISGEPKVEMSPRVKRIVGRALDAIHNGDGVEGERLIRQALEIEPDNPTLFNNLTKAYELQGRQQEAEELVYETHRRFPDYLFGRTNLAMLLIADGDPETAEELLKPLFLRREMHYSEFAAFAAAQIELALAERNRKRARSWFELWEQVNPDNPNLELFRSRVTSVRRLLSGFR